MKIAITHQNVDFDGLASLLGARKLWPDCEIVLSSAVSSPVKRYLALHRDWLRPKRLAELQGDVKQVVMVDSRARQRFSEFSQLLEGAEELIVFDHHPPGPDDIEADREILEPVGACATLFCERIEALELELDAEEATLLMLGIYADTGNLTFPSTTVRDLRAAAFLRQSGASLPVVNRYLQQEYSPQQQQLLVAMLSDMEILERDGLRIGCVWKTTQDYVKGAALVVERMMQMMGLDACFAVLQQEGRDVVALIGRSETRHVDVAAIAEKWGGGGHPSAAAARIKTGRVEEVFADLRELLCAMNLAPLEVRDVMTSPVQCVPHDMKLDELQRSLGKWGIRGVPVTREGELAGIVSRRDVDEAIRRGDWEIPAAGFMTHQVVTVKPQYSLSEALEMMTEQDIGRLPVVDDGKVVGIISRSDLLQRIYEGDGEEEGLLD